jgi:hypothetical protein
MASPFDFTEGQDPKAQVAAQAMPPPEQVEASEQPRGSANHRAPMRSESQRTPPVQREQRHRLRPIAEMAEDEPTGSRLWIDPKEFPEGFDLCWITKSVHGQPQPSHFSRRLKRGWVPVCAGDFEGKFDGRFTPPGHQGEIEVDGLVLAARDARWSAKARQEDRMNAAAAVLIKEQQLGSGELQGVKMGAQHPSALRFNKIRRSTERRPQ